MLAVGWHGTSFKKTYIILRTGNEWLPHLRSIHFILHQDNNLVWTGKLSHCPLKLTHKHAHPTNESYSWTQEVKTPTHHVFSSGAPRGVWCAIEESGDDAVSHVSDVRHGKYVWAEEILLFDIPHVVSDAPRDLP